MQFEVETIELHCKLLFLLIRWDHGKAEAILGGGAFYFTMMRDPVELFVSAWDYYGLAKTYNMSLEEFARRDTSGFMEFRVADDEQLHMANIQFETFIKVLTTNDICSL